MCVCVCFRPGIDDLVREMKVMGASEVVTEEFAASHRMKDLMTVSRTVYCDTYK